MVFLEADFSEEYIEYLYSKTDVLEAPYLTIYQSQEYNLASKDDREAAAKVLIALALWFEKTLDADLDTGSEDADAEDDTGQSME